MLNSFVIYKVLKLVDQSTNYHRGSEDTAITYINC